LINCWAVKHFIGASNYIWTIIQFTFSNNKFSSSQQRFFFAVAATPCSYLQVSLALSSTYSIFFDFSCACSVIGSRNTTPINMLWFSYYLGFLLFIFTFLGTFRWVSSIRHGYSPWSRKIFKYLISWSGTFSNAQAFRTTQFVFMKRKAYDVNKGRRENNYKEIQKRLRNARSDQDHQSWGLLSMKSDDS